MPRSASLVAAAGHGVGDRRLKTSARRIEIARHLDRRNRGGAEVIYAS